MIESPGTSDFEVILEELGQDVTIRRVIRELDSDGRVASTRNSDSIIKAIVDEFMDQKVDINSPGRYDIGDVKFTMMPDVVITNFDKLIWNDQGYSVKFMKQPMKIGGKAFNRIIIGAKEDVV